ncbi:MAG: 2-phosphosulfolactate phosphatase [Verrucomicrobiales bacterium]
MQTHVEVIFSPAEQKALQQRDLGKTVCVVFDILRATTTMVTALANGAEKIIPVSEIPEAVELRQQDASILLAGERHGLKIRGDLANGIDFDFGNSPREFQPDKVRGKSIGITTTNGTRALRAAEGSAEVLIGSFPNMSATAKYLSSKRSQNLLLVCSGTGEEASYEDVLGAGALLDAVWSIYGHGVVADSAQVARNIYLASSNDLLGAMKYARNGRRLAEIPELAGDLPICFQRDVYSFAASMSEGVIRKLSS